MCDISFRTNYRSDTLFIFEFHTFWDLYVEICYSHEMHIDLMFLRGVFLRLMLYLYVLLHIPFDNVKGGEIISKDVSQMGEKFSWGRNKFSMESFEKLERY